MKELKIPFKVFHGQFGFSTRDMDQLIADFIKFNEGKEGEIIYKIIERDTQYYQQKWYHGFLIPPIATESYSGNRFETHIRLKEMFLVRSVSSFSDIPRKYQSRAIPVYDIFYSDDLIEPKKVLVGYIPSTKNLTEAEMGKFILDVENFIAEEGFQIGYKEHEYEYRRRAFK